MSASQGVLAASIALRPDLRQQALGYRPTAGAWSAAEGLAAAAVLLPKNTCERIEQPCISCMRLQPLTPAAFQVEVVGTGADRSPAGASAAPEPARPRRDMVAEAYARVPGLQARCEARRAERQAAQQAERSNFLKALTAELSGAPSEVSHAIKQGWTPA